VDKDIGTPENILKLEAVAMPVTHFLLYNIQTCWNTRFPLTVVVVT
jgi:hypothetical protein